LFPQSLSAGPQFLQTLADGRCMGDRSQWLWWLVLAAVTVVVIDAGPSSSSQLNASASVESLANELDQTARLGDPADPDTRATESADLAESVDSWLPVEPVLEGEPQRYGDDEFFDKLWDECEAGSGPACESLFNASPVGSEYEQFGVSCGERPGILDCRRQLRDGEVISYSQSADFEPVHDLDLGTIPG